MLHEGELPLTHHVGPKDGEAFIAATFGAGKERRDSNVETVTALVLDIDNGVDSVDDFLTLWPWRGVAYSSFGNKPGHPKFRVVLNLSREVTREEHRLIWDWALRNSGGLIDRTGKNPSRLWYFPRVPDEASLTSAWVRQLDGPVLTPEECVALPRGTAVDVAIEVAIRNAEKSGSRNDAGYRLGRELMRCGLSRDQILEQGRRFVALCPSKDHPYTIEEFTVALDQNEKHPPKTTTDADKAYPFREVAAAIVKRFPLLVTSKDNPWEYIGTHWVPITHGRLGNLVQIVGPSAKARDANETIAYLMRTCHSGHTSPAWNQIDSDEVPMRNGVLSLRTMDLRAHRREDYLDRVLPHVWSPDAECPLWERCLSDWIGADEQAALQEFFGYCLLPHARWKKALILYGESNTGKSRVTDALVTLVGRSTVAGVPLDWMDDPRKLAPLRGAAINLVSDLAEKTILADGGFKTLVGGDEMQIDAKYEAPELYKPTAKVVVATNNLPRVNDRTAAVFNRLLIIHFARVFRDAEQDRDLSAKLDAESQGILVWAVEGAQRLAARGGAFHRVPTSDALVDDYRQEQNPVGNFLAEMTLLDPGARVRVSALHHAYLEWSKDRVSPAIFGRMLRGAGVTVKQLRHGDGVGKGVDGMRLR